MTTWTRAPSTMVTRGSISPMAPSFKRSRSTDSHRSSTVTPVRDTSKSTDDASDNSLPAFLRQNDSDVSTKFEAVQWHQQMRIHQGRRDKSPSSLWAQDSTKEARLRNRYADVWPWANSRIRLKVPEGACDYINASPITLHCSKTGEIRKYIATQGPKPSGLNEFWQMIWHETSTTAVIVMLTQLAEGSKEKCSQYYPEDLENDVLQVTLTSDSGEECEGHVKVVEKDYHEASKSTIRRLVLACGEETKTVWHLLFLGWSDYGIPGNEDRNSLLELIKLSRIKNDPPENARIIHCSAGVGRSGTFIALEHLLAELTHGRFSEAKDSDDLIYDTVDELRKQRMTMVQSLDQFRFLYDLLRNECVMWQKEQEIKANRPTNDLTDSSSGTGEPLPKSRKLSKGLRAVFLRESRAQPTADSNSNHEGKAPEDP